MVDLLLGFLIMGFAFYGPDLLSELIKLIQDKRGSN